MEEPIDALIVVDPQVGLLGLVPVVDAERLIDTLHGLLLRARAGSVPIVYLQNRGPAGSIDEPGTPGWPIHPRLAPEASDLVIEKTRDDGFVATPLADVLDGRRVGHVAVCGALSEMCVAATARGALARGFQVTVVTDAHATYDLDDIPARNVARVAEHALGDEVHLARAADLQL